MDTGYKNIVGSREIYSYNRCFSILINITGSQNVSYNYPLYLLLLLLLLLLFRFPDEYTNGEPVEEKKKAQKLR